MATAEEGLRNSHLGENDSVREKLYRFRKNTEKQLAEQKEVSSILVPDRLSHE